MHSHWGWLVIENEMDIKMGPERAGFNLLMFLKYMKTSILALENYLPKNSINELYFPYDALGAPVLQFQPIFYSFLEKREN